MTGLVFKKLWILSKLEKAARALEFGPTMNLLTGENDVGKSTLLKSLYHALGADAPQMDNTQWKRARPIYCVNVDLDGKNLFVIRDGKYFGVFDEDKNLLGRYQGITGDQGFAQFICTNLKFRIELERHSNSQLGRAGPAFYFLPFYIDQDEGWSTSWASFRGLQQFKSYRKNMIEYHLGVRPQSYYDAKKNELILNDELNALQAERYTLEKVQRTYKEKKAGQQVEVDPELFRSDVEQLVDRYNEVYSKQQAVLHRLKEVRGERNGIDTDIQILSNAISELNADYNYSEAPEKPDCIECPTCGTGITNSFAERFGILDDIDYCHGLIDQRRKDAIGVQELLSSVEAQYNEVSADLEGVNEVLQREKENVTFAELVTSEGIKELIASLTEDITDFQEKEEGVASKVRELADDLRLDKETKKSILEFYQARMKEYLNELNVHVLEEADYKTLDRIIKNNALGSDLPRSLLAQYFALSATMMEFTKPVICPMVIDSPQQQEQDSTNRDAMFKFIFEKMPEGQQLILATISTVGFSSGLLPDDIVRIELSDKFNVLQKVQYEKVLAEIGPLHEELLVRE